MVFVPDAASGQKTKLKGRVLAVSTASYLFSPCYDPMHGNNRLQGFIFGVEMKDRRSNESIVPVFVCYANYPNSEYFLAEGFFDYSKKYELSVIKTQVGGRNTKKDVNLFFKNVAYIQAVARDEDGNELSSLTDLFPPVLKILDGVPESILNMEMDIMLPRYELVTTKYKILKK